MQKSSVGLLGHGGGYFWHRTFTSCGRWGCRGRKGVLICWFTLRDGWGGGRGAEELLIYCSRGSGSCCAPSRETLIIISSIRCQHLCDCACLWVGEWLNFVLTRYRLGGRQSWKFKILCLLLLFLVFVCTASFMHTHHILLSMLVVFVDSATNRPCRQTPQCKVSRKLFFDCFFFFYFQVDFLCLIFVAVPKMNEGPAVGVFPFYCICVCVITIIILYKIIFFSLRPRCTSHKKDFESKNSYNFNILQFKW